VLPRAAVFELLIVVTLGRRDRRVTEEIAHLREGNAALAVGCSSDNPTAP
jgi:hypothetical protein